MAIDQIGSAGLVAGGVEPADLSTGAPYWDASGNVGIGTSSPGRKLQVNANQNGVLLSHGFNLTDYSEVTFHCAGISGSGAVIRSYRANDTFSGNEGDLRFYTNPGTTTSTDNAIERARIAAGGEICFGTIGSLGGRVNIGGYNDGGLYGVVMTPAANGSTPFRFNNAAGTQVGVIQCSTTNTTYVTTSDYRLKENVQPMAGALAKVAALKPCTYKWKADGSDGEGFIAHELAEVVPDAVTGEKDAVDEEGNIKPQGIDTSFLVATLTAAIQEQQAMIEELKAEVAALKEAK
jgi:hypothetical protein